MSIVTESPTYAIRERSNSAKYGKRMVEDRRVGLGDTDDVTVDDAAHLDVIAGPTWQTSRISTVSICPLAFETTPSGTR